MTNFIKAFVAGAIVLGTTGCNDKPEPAPIKPSSQEECEKKGGTWGDEKKDKEVKGGCW